MNNSALKETKSSSGDKVLTYVFTPSELGVSTKNPPTKANVTENQIENALFKKFGLNADNAQDAARLKELLKTDGSPFAAVTTTGNFAATRNAKTGNYEIRSRVDGELYKNLQGKAAAVKTQIEAEKAARKKPASR